MKRGKHASNTAKLTCETQLARQLLSYLVSQNNFIGFTPLLRKKDFQMALFTKTVVALGLFVASVSSTAMADTYHHIDQLALDIARQTETLASESRHYRHTPEYRHLLSDTREMARLADHMHDLAHHHGSISHLASDLAQLDAKFHHVESLFDHIEHSASYGYGHIHSNTSHVKRLLNSIANDIHHLEQDLATLRTPVCTTPVVVARPPIYTPRITYPRPTPSYNRHPQHDRHNSIGRDSHRRGSSVHDSNRRPSRGRTLSFGGGSTRFTVKF